MTFDPSRAVLDDAPPPKGFDPARAIPDDDPPPLRPVLRAVVQAKPDAAAEVERLAKRYPAPYEVIERNIDELRMFDAAEGIAERLSSAPLLEGAIRRNARLGKLAHDDIEPLAKIESGFAKVAAAGAGQAVLGISEGVWRTPDAAQRAVGYLADTIESSGLPKALNPVRGLQDVIRIVSEGRLPVGPKFMAGTTDVANRISDAQGLLSERETFGNAFADVQTLAKNADAALATAIKTGQVEQVGRVLTDPNYWAAFLSQAVPSLYLALKSGGSAAFMGWMEGMEQASSAADFEQRTGQKISNAEFTQAVAQTALINALLEKYGLDKILGAKGKGLSGVVKAMTAEGGTEALQQINTNIAAALAYNPEQPFSEGVLSALMGGIGAGGGVSSAQAASRRIQASLDKRQQQINAAEQGAQNVQGLLEASGQSALRQRSPEQFRALMQQVADSSDGASKAVYVDGDVLNQLPAEVLAALPQEVQEQIPAAAQAGTPVAIPMADVLTVAPGTPLEQVLLEHGRMDPFALSPADAQAAGDQAQALKEQTQRVVEQASQEEAWALSTEAVRAGIEAQINATGRYRPAVAEGMSHWAGAFYATMAARTGMTPEQFAAQYPLRIVAEATQQGSALEQGGPVAQAAQAVQAWQKSLRDSATNAQVTPRMATPTTLRELGVKQPKIEMPVGYLRAVLAKHPDIPRSVFENLPALMSDPLFVLPHREGGVTVVLDAQTEAGAPIAVGVRDGRVRTVTPIEASGGQSANERLQGWINQARGKIYARNNEAPAVAGASAEGGSGANSLAPFGPNSRRSVLTRAKLVNRYGANFYQGEANPRATFNPQTLEIVLNPSADLSTFFHEAGHFYLEVLADLAGRPDAPAQVAADMQALLQWFGVADLAAWQAMTLEQQRPFHERWAESIEQYLMEGKAPSAELAPLMRRFRAWLVAAYRSLKQFLAGRPDAAAMPLNDDIRRVMDRMLATDEQIAQAQEVAGMLPDEAATAEAIERQQARSMRDLQWSVKARDKVIAKLKREARAVEKEVRAQVTAEVDARPEVQARRALAELKKAGTLDDMSRATVADAFGFASVDEMHQAIDAFGSRREAIDGLTEQRMLEEHGDLVDERAIQEAANEAVHNAARARALATELKAQADALGQRQDTGETNAAGARITVSALAEAARQFGAGIAARTTLADLRGRIWQHTAAERRAAGRWRKATAAGQTQEAIKAKQDQVLNNAAARALVDAKDEAAGILEFFKRVTKGRNEKVVERGRDPDIVNAARAVLAAYGVDTGTTRAAGEYLDKLKTHDPETWNVVAPMVDAATQAAQPLQALTVEQLQGLHEEVQAMWHLARRSRQLDVDGNLMDIEDAAAALSQRMQEIGVPAEAPGEKGAITKQQERVRWLQSARALLRRTEQWAEAMDGKWGGPFLRYVFQPVKEAADRYRTDRAVYRRKFQALVDAVAPHLQHKLIEAPELGYTFGQGHNGIGMAELLHAILHTGNESNKRKLLLGRKWGALAQDGQTLDTGRWDAFIARLIREGTLKREHFDFAQGVWDLLEETKPLAQATHRDVFGAYFDEITADPVTNALGTWRGGYVPAQADPLLVDDASLRALAESENESMAYSFPQTNRGFTKGRVEYNRPLKLDLRTIPQHLDKVLLFGHMEAPVRGVTRLLRQPEVSQPLGHIDPSIYSGMLLPWLNRSARQQVETPVVGDGRITRVLSVARSRAGAALMFANVSNTIQQLTGLSLAAVKVRPALLLSAAAQYLTSPRKVADQVAEASPYMADRMRNEVAAMNGEMQRILLGPSVYERAQAWTMRHAYFMQAAFDNVIGPVVWTGAYNQALADGMDERDAVRFADGTIRQTQGSTQAEDVSRIETGPPYGRIFTQFIGYFNMMANTNATALVQIAREMGLRKGAGKALYVLMAGMLMPLWVAEAIAVAMRGGPDDEDKDGEYLDDWIAAVLGMGTIKGVLAQVPFIGQLANAGINRMNSNPADDRMSMSPAVSLLEAGVGAPVSVYKAIVDDGSAQKAVRDVASLLSVATGLPFSAAARPIGYAAGLADGRIDPTGPVDAARGMVSGVASQESRVP